MFVFASFFVTILNPGGVCIYVNEVFITEFILIFFIFYLINLSRRNKGGQILILNTKVMRCVIVYLCDIHNTYYKLSIVGRGVGAKNVYITDKQLNNLWPFAV